MQIDQPAFIIGAALLVATAAATMTARQVARPWALFAWAVAALLFAWIGYWTYQDSVAAGGVTADRAVVVGGVAVGSLLSGLCLVVLALKGSLWSARIVRSIVRFLFGWFPWRLQVTRQRQAVGPIDTAANSTAEPPQKSLLQAMAAVPANPESFERFRELWEPTKKAMRRAHKALFVTAGDLRAREGVAKVAGELLEPFLTQFAVIFRRLEDKVLAGGETEADVHLLNELYLEAADVYARAVNYWIWIELDDNPQPAPDEISHFYRSQEYGEFYTLHRAMLRKIASFRGRYDFLTIMQGLDKRAFFESDHLFPAVS